MEEVGEEEGDGKFIKESAERACLPTCVGRPSATGDSQKERKKEPKVKPGK